MPHKYFFSDCSWTLRYTKKLDTSFAKKRQHFSLRPFSFLLTGKSYDYDFKLDTYTPVSILLDALETTVVFKIERRYHLWSPF